jgi:hypothetical protein
MLVVVVVVVVVVVLALPASACVVWLMVWRATNKRKGGACALRICTTSLMSQRNQPIDPCLI